MKKTQTKQMCYTYQQLMEKFSSRVSEENFMVLTRYLMNPARAKEVRFFFEDKYGLLWIEDIFGTKAPARTVYNEASLLADLDLHLSTVNKCLDVNIKQSAIRVLNTIKQNCSAGIFEGLGQEPYKCIEFMLNLTVTRLISYDGLSDKIRLTSKKNLNSLIDNICCTKDLADVLISIECELADNYISLDQAIKETICVVEQLIQECILVLSGLSIAKYTHLGC